MNAIQTSACFFTLALFVSLDVRAEPPEQQPGGSAARQAAPEKDVATPHEERDERRKVELVWLRPTAGYTSLNLTTFEADEQSLTADLIPSHLNGAAFGLGAGVRLLFVSFGVNGRVDLFSDDSDTRTVHDFQRWTLDGNVLFHLLSGYQLEPYFQLGAGYSAFGGLNDAVRGSDYAVNGWNVHGGIGLDYFLEDNFSLGALLSGELMFLARKGVSSTALLTPQEVSTVGEARARLLEADGASVGTGFSIVAGPSLHF